MFKVPNRHRVKTGKWGSDDSEGKNGMFTFAMKSKVGKNVNVATIASDQEGWEHVSVSLPGLNRCPTWEEVCFVKSLFWDDEDCVVQYHPAKSESVNYHPYCLHLWRPVGRDILTPPPLFVGPIT
jgi:hypothetical protein